MNNNLHSLKPYFNTSYQVFIGNNSPLSYFGTIKFKHNIFSEQSVLYPVQHGQLIYHSNQPYLYNENTNSFQHRFNYTLKHIEQSIDNVLIVDNLSLFDGENRLNPDNYFFQEFKTFIDNVPLRKFWLDCDFS